MSDKVNRSKSISDIDFHKMIRDAYKKYKDESDKKDEQSKDSFTKTKDEPKTYDKKGKLK